MNSGEHLQTGAQEHCSHGTKLWDHKFLAPPILKCVDCALFAQLPGFAFHLVKHFAAVKDFRSSVSALDAVEQLSKHGIMNDNFKTTFNSQVESLGVCVPPLKQAITGRTDHLNKSFPLNPAELELVGFFPLNVFSRLIVFDLFFTHSTPALSQEIAHTRQFYSQTYPSYNWEYQSWQEAVICQATVVVMTGAVKRGAVHLVSMYKHHKRGFNAAELHHQKARQSR